MEHCVTLHNPLAGADIFSNYVEKGKENYQEVVEMVDGVQKAYKKVTNSAPFVLKKGEKIEVPEHQAEWAMKTWGFLRQEGMVNPPPTEAIKVEPIRVHEVPKQVVHLEEKPRIVEDALFPRSDADRFAELKLKGYLRLKGPEREEYNKLKKLNK